jgi:hypothetical protein
MNTNNKMITGEEMDIHLLHWNFLEFLTNYLEGERTLSMVLQASERIYKRDPKTLSEPLTCCNHSSAQP